ncbi:hypothetical protein GGR08_000560 [Bartonella fuyuanensis]|uniref:Uncharacterized protein n=1 Tax=Bartonella fuyuanensis TaxID=1460968 RepID=A0A840E047_9HYPH|nr:hypothetical protein [Bartonella fuyuanensis]
MISSIITLIVLFFLLAVILNGLIWGIMVAISYLFIKHARLYCRVKKELKYVLNERDRILKQISQKSKETEFSM